jgi:hypothetical protein
LLPYRDAQVAALLLYIWLIGAHNPSRPCTLAWPA